MFFTSIFKKYFVIYNEIRYRTIHCIMLQTTETNIVRFKWNITFRENIFIKNIF